MRYQKINTLVLEGPTNAGKSLLLDIIIKELQPEEIPRESDNSAFHLDQLPNATFEEPIITPSNVGTWKLLLEGKQIKTDVKHKDKEAIKRVPIWITTATPLDDNVDKHERVQLQQRYKLFRFTKIEHNISNNNHTIKKAEQFLTTRYMAIIFILFWDDVYRHIKETDYKYIINKDHIQITEECYLQLNALQTVLQMQKNIADLKEVTIQHPHQMESEMEHTQRTATGQI